jgi:hypothetical protein
VKTRGTLLAVCVALLGGCAPEFETLVIEKRSSPPASVQLGGDAIVVPPGIAVVVEVEPKSATREEYEDDAVVELLSADARIFDVLAGTEDREFAFVGITEGETCMEVRIDGHEVDCIDVQVRWLPE